MFRRLAIVLVAALSITTSATAEDFNSCRELFEALPAELKPVNGEWDAAKAKAAGEWFAANAQGKTLKDEVRIVYVVVLKSDEQGPSSVRVTAPTNHRPPIGQYGSLNCRFFFERPEATAASKLKTDQRIEATGTIEQVRTKATRGTNRVIIEVTLAGSKIVR